MTPLFPAQRAAEEFDSVLDGRATQAVADRYADLFATVRALREQPEVSPRAEFVSDLRSRLMLAAETELVAAPPVVRPLRPAPRHGRRVGTVAAALVIVGGSAGLAAASSSALPGQALYPVKRGTEQVAAAVRFGDAAKGAALLGQAGNRLDEVGAMLSSGSADPALLGSTLDSFQSSADAGSGKLFTDYQASGNSADIATVRAFTADQMPQIASLAKGADPSTATGLRDAADALADIDQQARTLCGACGDGSPALTTPLTLSSSAGAASVDNLIARPASRARADVTAAVAAAAARAAQQSEAIGKLQDAAQQSAAGFGSGTTGSTTTGALGGSGSGTTGLPSTVTASGGLLPSITGNGTVKDLVSGVTSSLNSGGGSSGSVVDGVTGTVKGLTDGVTSGLDDTTQGLPLP